MAFFYVKERYNADDKNVTDNNFGIGADTRRDDRGKGYKQYIKKVWNCRRTDKKVLLVIEKRWRNPSFFLYNFIIITQMRGAYKKWKKKNSYH